MSIFASVAVVSDDLSSIQEATIYDTGYMVVEHPMQEFEEGKGSPQTILTPQLVKIMRDYLVLSHSAALATSSELINFIEGLTSRQLVIMRDLLSRAAVAEILNQL